MEIVHTDGKHPDFVALNIYLEEFFNDDLFNIENIELKDSSEK